MKNKKKTLVNLIFLLLCSALTMYYVFHDQNFGELMEYMEGADSIYWLGGVLLVIAFILSESFIIFYMLKSLQQKVKLTHCFLYSFVGFFFSLITPSATGGQPAQILFMKRDRIPIHISTMVLLIVTVTYKLVLVFFGLAVLTVGSPIIMMHLEPALPWVYLGIVLNVICVTAMLALILSPKLAKRIVMTIFGLVNRIFKSPKIAALEARVERSMEGYRDASEYFRTHIKIMINVLLITILQRCFLFYITYLAFLSFGFLEVSMVQVVVLQAMISVSVDMLPMPGGMGISEHLFEKIFILISGSDLTTPIMIVSRGISYYTQLIISAAFTAIAYLVVFKKEEEK